MASETSPLLPDDTIRNRPLSYNGTESIDNGDAHQPKSSLKFIVAPLALGIFLAAMDTTIVLSSYAAIGSELNQLQNTSWIATGFMLTLTGIQPLYGKLSDIFGRKACLLFAYTTFALGCLFCGLARNMSELIIARAFAGVGGGGMTTVASIIMSDVVTLRSRGTWQGILNIVFAMGSSTGAPLGGFLTDTIGWRWAFLIQVPATVAAIITVSLALHLPKVQTSDFRANLKRVDFCGAITLMLAIFSLLLGLDRGGNISWNDNLTICSLIAFASLSIMFVTIEAKFASEPFAPKYIIFNRSLIASFLVNFFGFGAAVTSVYQVSLYVQAVLGKTASQAGVYLLPSIVGGVFGSLAGGLLMQATGKYYWLTFAGYVLMVAGTASITLLSGILATSVTGIMIGLVLSNIGNASGVTTSLVSIIANAGPENQAIATAVSYLFRSLGSVVMLSVGSFLVQNSLRTYLNLRLSGDDAGEIIRRVRESLSYIDELDPVTQAIVRVSYEEALHVTLWFTVALCVCAAAASIFIKEKSLVG